jgi:hypothetical protein
MQGYSSTVYSCTARDDECTPYVVKVIDLVDDQLFAICQHEFNILKRVQQVPGIIKVKGRYINTSKK